MGVKIRADVLQAIEQEVLDDCKVAAIAMRHGVSESTVRRIKRAMQRVQEETPKPRTLGRRILDGVKWFLFGTFCVLLFGGAQYPAPGTVFATRNAGGEEANTTPGSERNHVALMTVNGYVVEAQGPPLSEVGAVKLEHFFARYPDIKAYRLVDDATGLKWAKAAVEQLGKPYQLVRANCVTLLRTSYPGRQRWRRPDHVVEGGTLLWKKFVPDNQFTPPADPWASWTTDRNKVLGMQP